MSLLTHEQALKILVGAFLHDMAQAFNRKPDAIRIKLSRLGLKVVVRKKPRKPRTTTSRLVPSGLLTHEKAF